MEKNLVSIIIPAYNAEKYIKGTLDSVLAQTYTNFEAIVVNDCSKDNTEKIIDEYVAKDSRIKKYNNPKNSGVSYTRNFAISVANGEWIAFVDSDDMWEPTKLEKQINFANTTEGADFIYTGSSFIDEDGNPYNHVMNVPEKVTYKELLKQNIISCSSVLIKKECLEGVKMPSDKMHEDFATWLTILKNKDCAYGINEPLLIYRISRNSKSGNKKKAAKMTYEVYKYAGLNIFQRAYYMFNYVYRSLKKYNNIKSK